MLWFLIVSVPIAVLIVLTVRALTAGTETKSDSIAGERFPDREGDATNRE